MGAVEKSSMLQPFRPASYCSARSTRAFVVVALIALSIQSQAVRAALTATGDVLPNPLVPNQSIQIASTSNGAGFLTIDSGTSFVSNSVQIGSNSTGLGIATVTGAGSAWSTLGMDLGSSGYGKLEIRNGAFFSGSTQFRLGNNSGGSGTLVVQDPGTVMQLNTSLIVGSSGEGLMQLGNGAIVNLVNNTTTIGSQGRLEMSGGLLRTNQLTNNGTLVGDGEVYIQSTTTMTNNGRINANSGDRLYLSGPTGPLQNNGEIGTEGGEIEFVRPISNLTSNGTAAQITLRNGIIRFATAGTSTIGLTNAGVLASTGGENDVYGRIENNSNGDIGVTNSSVLTFHHDVSSSNGSTITVFPGSVAVFLQDLTVSGGGLILANIAGTNDNTGFGRVEVVGTATINGVVQASLAQGFTPQEGDTFQLLSAGSIAGTPTLGTMPALPNGLSWDLDVQANRMLLSVILAGDYNGDGHVDAADYTIWRDTLGSTTDLRADGNGNHVIDTPDFAFWKSHFNASAGSGGGSVGSPQGVPEPAACTMMIVGVAAFGAWSLGRGGKQRAGTTIRPFPGCHGI
jgi:T5SS/PEP-CTERM-associated repeat protein